MHLKIKLVKLGILVFLEALSTIFIEKKKPPRFHCETFHVFSVFSIYGFQKIKYILLWTYFH